MRTTRAHVALATALVLAVACSGGRSPARIGGLRATLTESAGDMQFTLPEPIREVTCVVRDQRRDPSSRGATTLIWAARCTADCLPTVRYGDRTLESTTPARTLAPSPPGTCYECVVYGSSGSGFVSFRTGPRGGFQPCAARAGTL